MRRRISATSEQLEERMLLSAYDAAADFSTTSNPNRAWSYGERVTETSPFVRYPTVSPLDFGSGAVGWSGGAGSPPYIGVNVTGSTYSGLTLVLPTGVLAMHPGPSGQYSDTRFTVPAAGPVSARFKFTGIDTTGTTTDVHVLHNGVSISNGAINAYGDTFSSSVSISSAAAGDTLDFIVGYGSNGNYQFDGTSLTAQVTTADKKLAFVQGPKDTAANDTIKPLVTVEVENSDGTRDTSSSDVVTLVVASSAGTGKGTLSGTVSEPAVNGLATFSNLSINLGGDYQLSATDTTNLSATAALSGKFKITGNRLVFKQQPLDGDLRNPISLIVDLVDSKNNLIVDDTTSVVLTLNVITGGTGAILLGTTSVKLSGGKAVFTSSAGPSINADSSGVYTLTATKDNASAAPDAATASATSEQFKVSGYHLAFLDPPTDTDSHTPLPFQVAVENSKDKFVTSDNTDFLLVKVNPAPGAPTPTVTGFDYLPVRSGIFDNESFRAPFAITTPGTYTLTVYAVDQDGVPYKSTVAVTSKPFKIIGFHFVFIQQPSDTDVKAPIPFKVELENSRNEPAYTGIHFGVGFTLNSIQGNGKFIGTGTAYLADGIDNNLATVSGYSELVITAPGTYTLTATEIDGNGVPVAGTQTTKSNSFKINGYHFVFIQQPSDTDVKAPIPFVVQLENSKNKPALTGILGVVGFTLNRIQGNGVLNGLRSAYLTNSADNNLNPATPPGNQLSITAPGIYTLTAEELDAYGYVDATTQKATSKSFKITGYHFVFVQQPSDADVIAPIPFVVELENSKNKPVYTGILGVVGFILNPIEGKGVLTGTRSEYLTDSIDNNLNPGGPPGNELTITAPGTYTLTAEELDAYGYPITSTQKATSESFKISGYHLAFLKQPAHADVKMPLPFEIAIEDSNNKVVSSDNSDGLRITVIPAPGAPVPIVTGLIYLKVQDGVDDNASLGSPVAIATPGTYTLSVFEVDQNGSPVLSTPDITSNAFVVSVASSAVHLVFRKPPANTSVNSPIPFQVVLEDGANKIINNDSTDGVLYTLNTLSGGKNAKLSGSTTQTFSNGVDDNTIIVTGGGPLSITAPGTYTLTAQEVDPQGKVIVSVGLLTSGSFKII